jgi:O-antigen ligase
MNHIIKDIILRTVYTFLESLLSMLVVGNLISSFDWIAILSVSATAALIAFIRAVMAAIKKIDPEVTD